MPLPKIEVFMADCEPLFYFRRRIIVRILQILFFKCQVVTNWNFIFKKYFPQTQSLASSIFMLLIGKEVTARAEAQGPKIHLRMKAVSQPASLPHVYFIENEQEQIIQHLR